MGHRIASLPLCALLLTGFGCGQKPVAVPDTVTKSTITKAPSGPSKVELTDAKATLDPPRLVKFQVNYKFVEGGPRKSYLCEITFPGTTNLGRKYIESWELKDSGTIRDGIELQTLEPEAKSFEIQFKEAEVPQDGYNLISNVISGTIQ